MSEFADDTEQLTETQQTLLETAIDRGYFEVPRRVTLVELADEHDISDQRASRELRGGLNAVLWEWVETTTERTAESDSD